jgi:hypothetical protein
MQPWKRRYGGDWDGWLSQRACLTIILVASALLVGIVLLAMWTPEP